MQHTATHCNTLQHIRVLLCEIEYLRSIAMVTRLTLQHTATALQPHCNILQHAVTHYNTLQHTATHCNTLQHTAAHIQTPASDTHCSDCVLNVCCSVLQCVAVCCSVFQRVTVCCSVLQRVAVCCSVTTTDTHFDLPSNSEELEDQICVCT